MAMAFRRALPSMALALGLAGCGVGDLSTLEERAKGAWGEVQNQYQRRLDLVPNLVETVKGHAAQEREVLAQVTEARARAVQVKVDVLTITDPQKFREYRQAQDQLSAAFGRLLAAVERYPELKSSAGFLTLQAQLEVTDNRIAVARRDYGEAARAYNAELQAIPGRWIAAMLFPNAKPLETFSAAAGPERPPATRF